MDNFSPGHLPQTILPSQRVTRENLNKMAYAIRKMNQGVIPPTIVQPVDLQYPQQPPNVVGLEPINVIIDGGGAAITTSSPTMGGANVEVEQPCNIIGWTVIGDQSGSIEIDVTRANKAVPSTSIIGSGTKPALSSEQYYSHTPSDWTSTALAPGDMLGFSVASATTVQRVTLILKVSS